MSHILLNENISVKDKVQNGLWARTEVLVGTGNITVGKDGKSTLDEVLFTGHNIVPIGGCSYVMEKIFGVKENQIDIPTLYDQTGIGLANSTSPTETYVTPDGNKTVIYRPGHMVQLFAIGITGTGENDVTVYNPDYRENGIEISYVSADGLTVEGTMIPFRYTSETLDINERKMYFGKKTDTDGTVAYYLKKFEYEPEIKHIWKVGEDDEDNETLVSSSDVWSNTSGLNSIESFTEITFKLTKKDVKEWFAAQEQEDRARINTIALYNGEYMSGTTAADFGDYRDCRLFSKLCINPEYLQLNKELTFIYRVYTS